MSVDIDSLEMTERVVLFASLRDDTIRTALLAEASVDWFLSVPHRKLFAALKVLVSSNTPIDTVGIHRAARSNDKACVGDVVIESEWLNQAMLEYGLGMDAETLAESHMPVLRQAMQTRKLQEFCFSAAEKASTITDPDKLMTWAMKELEKISADSNMRSEVKTDHQIILESMTDEDEEDQNFGPLTKIPELDQLNFRLTPGQLITVAGRPGECKTLLAAQISLGASTQCPVLVFALEDGFKDWQRRRLTMIAGQNGDVYRKNDSVHSGFAFERRSEYLAVAQDRPLYVVSANEHLNSYDIIAKIREYKLKHANLGVVIIDQTYDISDYDDRRGGENLTYSIFRLLSRLKAAAAAMDISVILLQHVKDVKGRPEKNDIADSQYFYKMSRKVVLISHVPSEIEGLDPEVLVDVAKFTQGRPTSVLMHFNGAAQKLGSFVDPLYKSDYR